MPETLVSEQVYQVGPYTLDVRKGTLAGADDQAYLRPKAYSLLLHLAQNMGRVVPKSELMDAVWPGIYVTEDSLTQSIREIRKALKDDEQGLVRTVSRRGYMLAGNSAPPAPERKLPVVAVLRFQNEGGDPAHEGLVDGIAEDIINGLARFGSMTVLARNSSFEFDSFAAGAWSATASRIGADYLVEGSVRRAGDRFLVTVNLIDAARLAQIWGERYEAEGVGVFTIERQIGEQIVSRLVSRLDDDRVRKAEVEPAASLAAYELVLRGVKYMRNFMDSPADEARVLFEEAIARDPSYGLAYGHLALEKILAGGLGGASPTLLAEAMRLATKCITLSPNQSMGHRMLSLARLYRREHAGAEHDLNRALALNPCDADAVEQMGYLLILRGRAVEGIAWIDKAVRLNPMHPGWYDFDRALALYVLGEYRQAADILERSNRFSAWVPTLLAACYAQLGETKPAATQVAMIAATNAKFSAIDEAKNTIAFEHSADIEHLVEGVALALDMVRGG